MLRNLVSMVPVSNNSRTLRADIPDVLHYRRGRTVPRAPCWAVLVTLLGAPGCGPAAREVWSPAGWERHVVARGSLGRDTLAGVMWRAEVCAGEDLRPERARIGVDDLSRFLQSHGVLTHVERPRANLAYLTLIGPNGARGPRLRVATLRDANAAGRELSRAIFDHGEGSWGVHRANLAVLGPAEDARQVVSWLAETKLSCWGVATLSSGHEVLVIPGAYREL